jgi:SAM-dependent methyltransferase
VELAPALAAVLREELQKQGLADVRVFEGDILDPNLEIPAKRYRLVVLAEVVASHFRDAAQLRRLFESAQKVLAPGGLLVFSAFLTSDGYKPDAAARELSQVFWCCLFTRRELADATAGLPFERVSDESVSEFEHEHLPESAWPPTGWFAEWTGGQDLFDLPEGHPPMELRWLVYRLSEAAEKL